MSETLGQDDIPEPSWVSKDVKQAAGDHCRTDEPGSRGLNDKGPESKRGKLRFGVPDLEEEPLPMMMTKGEGGQGEIKARVTGGDKVKALSRASFFLGSMLITSGSLIQGRCDKTGRLDGNC